MLRRASPYLCAAGVAGALWLIFPFGFPNYDTAYSLVFGNELVHGISPDYGVTLPPTPHPLAQIWGMFVAPLGSSGASAATTALAYLALGAVAYLVYRLGSVWFDRPIRRPRGADSPHARAVSEPRPPRLRRPALPRPPAGRARD